MLITEPPPALINSGMPCLQQKARPLTLIAIVRSQIASIVVRTDSSASSKMPALLYRTSSLPKRPTAVSTKTATSASRATSPITATACPSRLATVSWTALSLTSAATTFAPSRTNAWAATRPIPLPAPVISATLPSSRPISPPLELRGASPARASHWPIAWSDALRLGLRGGRPLRYAGLAINRASLHLGLQALHVVFRAHHDGAGVVVLAPEQVVEPTQDQEDRDRWSGPGAGRGEPTDDVARVIGFVLGEHEHHANERHPDDRDPADDRPVAPEVPGSRRPALGVDQREQDRDHVGDVEPDDGDRDHDRVHRRHRELRQGRDEGDDRRHPDGARRRAVLLAHDVQPFRARQRTVAAE